MRLLIPQPEGAYILDVASRDVSILSLTGNDGSLRRVAAAFEGRPVLDPQLSPDGRYVAFVQDREIHVAACDSMDESEGGIPAKTRITFGAKGHPHVYHGLSEFIAAEEMNRQNGWVAVYISK